MRGTTGYTDFKSVVKENLIFFLLIFSLYVGQGISYGPLCLFHFTIPLYFFIELRNGLNWKELFIKELFPFHLLYLLIFGISLLHPLNYSYLYFYGLSYLILCLLWMKRDFIVSNYRILAIFVFCLFSLDIIIASLEFLSPFRYPISRLSTVNNWFGRNYDFFASGTECFDLNYVQSSPTGFHWNQNNLAFVLLIFFPFTYLIKNPWLKNVLRALLMVLVVSAGARLGFYTLVLLYSILWVAELRMKQWQQLLPILTLVFILTDGFYVFPTQMKKVKEVAVVSQSEFTDRFPEHCYDKMNSKDSRNELLANGKKFLFENLIKGNGAGGFTAKMQKLNQGKEKNEIIVTNAHNYGIELLVDFGMLILLPLLWIFVILVKYLRKKERSHLLIVSLIFMSFLAGSVMVSSLVYFLPFYLFFFLIYIIVTAEKGSLYLD
jgi:hypothetical protein